MDNLDYVDSEQERKRRNKLLPNSFHATFCGSSGYGKTNALLSLYFNENGLTFENVYVYLKSLYQTKYQLLQDLLETVKGVSYFTFRDNEDVIDPADARYN